MRGTRLILAAAVSVNASYTVLIPFVPDLADRAGAGPAVIALTFALFAATKSLAQPVGGWWTDRWRAGPVACASLLIAAAGIVLTAVARDPVTLLAGRAVWGIGEGLVSPALYAGMSALCRVHRLSTSRMMGNFSSAAVAGFLLGPLVAGLAAPLELGTLFAIGAALTAATALGLLRAIPDVPPEPVPVAVAVGETGPQWWRWVLVIGLLDLFTSVIYTSLEPVLPLYLSAGRPASARTAISAVFVVGLATSGVAMWWLGRHTERLRPLRLVLAGLPVLGAGLAGIGLFAGVFAVAGWLVLFMVGYALLFLAARRAILELPAAKTHQGKAFGLFGAVSDVGNVAGPVLGTVLYELTGRLAFVLLGALPGVLLGALLATTGRRAAKPVLAPSGAGSCTPGTASHRTADAA